MNNFTFGDSGMGYYETIAGGAGAGPSWHGRSGVHTHMTNTRITGTQGRLSVWAAGLDRATLPPALPSILLDAFVSFMTPQLCILSEAVSRQAFFTKLGRQLRQILGLPVV